MEKRERIEWIDAVKALAILLVVVGHACNIYEEGTLLHDIIYLFHMPFFFMISGIVWGMFSRKAIRGGTLNITCKRAIDLFIPSFVFGICGGISGVWFCVVLAACIVGENILESCCVNGHSKIKTILLTIIIVLAVIFSVFEFYMMNASLTVPYFGLIRQLANLLCYFSEFHVGILLCKNRDKLLQINGVFVFYIIGFIGCVLLCLIFHWNNNLVLTKGICGLFAGGWIITLYSNCRKNCTKVERIIGRHTLEIYLIHQNLIHVLVLQYINLETYTPKERFLFAVAFFAADLIVPFIFVWLEEHFTIIQFIFHPSKAVKKWKSRYVERV